MQEPDPARTPQEPGGVQAPVLQTDLRRNSLGLVGVTMQAITHIAPAIAALFFTQFIVSLAGITAPLAYVVAGAPLLPGPGAGAVDPERGRGARRERGGVREGGGRPDMTRPAIHA